MDYKQIPPMTPERWIANLIEAAADIADQEKQERRWLAQDAYAWERPEEVINVLLDNCNFELFVADYETTFSSEQRQAAFDLRDAMNHYCDAAPEWLDPAEVLGDPRWHAIRQKAEAFVHAFKDKWPLA